MREDYFFLDRVVGWILSSFGTEQAVDVTVLVNAAMVGGFRDEK